MGKEMTIKPKSPAVCIIDDSAMTTKIYSYLVKQFLDKPDVSVFNHPWDVDIRKMSSCDLIIIDEVMDDITGTSFIQEVLNDHFKGRYHEFPNVIFASSLDSGDIHERIKSKRLDKMIPSFRVLTKPISPEVFRTTMISICPRLEFCMMDTVEIPNSELPWLISVKKAIDEILGISEDNQKTPHCMITI